MIIILPMTGSNRFQSEEYFYPKPLIEIYQKPMLQIALEAYFNLDISLYLPIISRTDKTEYNLDAVLEQILHKKDFLIHVLDGSTSGSLCTSMLAADLINNKEEVLIINYDQYFDFNLDEALNEFKKAKSDFGVICFDSTHPKWSYVQLDPNNNIERVEEKKPISRNAMAGIYYFKNYDIFKNAASKSLIEAPTDKNNFYISDALNHCILSGMNGKAYKIDRASYEKFSQPSDLEKFIEQNT